MIPNIKSIKTKAKMSMVTTVPCRKNAVDSVVIMLQGAADGNQWWDRRSEKPNPKMKGKLR